MLNVIQQARLSRRISGLFERVQRAEGYFSGVPISTARIGDASITTAKIEDGAITTAKIANATIENAKINDLNATKITTGTLDADRIEAGTITSGKLNVSTLSVISANLGSVNAGSITGVIITGGTIRTSSSGDRVEMTGSPERLVVYEGSNKRVQLGSGFIILYGSNSITFATSGGTEYGYLDTSSTSMNLISSSDASDGLQITNINGDITIAADDVINLIAPTVKILGSTKTAIVPTKQGYKALYCAEAPDVWFMDFYKDKVDPMFNNVTEGKQYEFNCINGKKLLFAKRKGFSNTRFEIKTKEEFERNNKFYA